jgi:hypothetical protein
LTKLKNSAVDLIGLWVFNDTVLLMEENRENHIHFASYLLTVLIHGCFHNGPVICPRLVIMALGRLYWPEAMPRAIMT